MADKFESLIKQALIKEAEAIDEPSDLFLKIKSSVQSKSFKTHNTFSFRKPAAVLAFCLIAVFALLFGFSGQTRIMAAEAINAIKIFFVLDEDMNVVAKPSDELLMTYRVSKTTYLCDEDIEKLLEYRVHFPDRLPGGYRLTSKSLGLTLETEILYETYIQIEKNMLNAVEDDDELRKLKNYKPHRNIFAVYKNDDGSTIFINTSLLTKEDKEQWEAQQRKKEIKAGDLEGYWLEDSIPVYPFKMENGIGSSDMTKPPVNIRTVHTLVWKNEKLKFAIYSYLYDSCELSLETALQLAEEFERSQH
jgi:hypothetical protein